MGVHSKDEESDFKKFYMLYFKCISGIIYTDDDERRPYQAGFLLTGPNNKTVEFLEVIVIAKGYTHRLSSYFPQPIDYLQVHDQCKMK